MPDEVKLVIGGQEFTGWQEVDVVRSVDSMAGRFSLKLTRMSPDPIPRGSEVELYLNNKLVITGYVFNSGAQVESNRYSVNASGRDKTGDLVDADCLADGQEVAGLTLKELVQFIIKPFTTISATFEVDPPQKFKKFSFQQESAFEAIERACRMRGVLCSSDESGNVIIRTFGNSRSPNALIEGDNVIASSSSFDDSNRFDRYYVYGQQPGSDEIDVEETAGPKGVAYDKGMGRYRPKIIIAEGAVDSGLAQERAEWEATVNAAKSETASATVLGWTNDSGELWRENQLVRTVLPSHGINSDMLIKEIRWSLSSQDGTKTTMQLVRPDAYKKQPDLEAAELKKDEGDDE